MTSDKLVSKINAELKSAWTNKEIKMGKSVLVEWTWGKTINAVIKKYEERGWTVTKYAVTDGSDRDLYLSFKNEKWLAKKKKKRRV